MIRINNFYNDIDKKLLIIDERISKSSSEISRLEKMVGKNAKTYDRYEYFLALEEDEKQIMAEIDKMSKERSYTSNFTPKSHSILKSMDNKLDKEKNLER